MLVVPPIRHGLVDPDDGGVRVDCAAKGAIEKSSGVADNGARSEPLFDVCLGQVRGRLLLLRARQPVFRVFLVDD